MLSQWVFRKEKITMQNIGKQCKCWPNVVYNCAQNIVKIGDDSETPSQIKIWCILSNIIIIFILVAFHFKFFVSIRSLCIWHTKLLLWGNIPDMCMWTESVSESQGTY